MQARDAPRRGGRGDAAPSLCRCEVLCLRCLHAPSPALGERSRWSPGSLAKYTDDDSGGSKNSCKSPGLRWRVDFSPPFPISLTPSWTCTFPRQIPPRLPAPIAPSSVCPSSFALLNLLPPFCPNRTYLWSTFLCLHR